jgi:Tol biopolymer transport system component
VVAGLALGLAAAVELDRPATAGPASTAAATEIAFSFGGRIHVMSPDGLERRRLTGGRYARRKTEDIQPAWSPDGMRLAFARTREASTDRSRIYLLDVASGRMTALTGPDPNTQGFDPAWSPDGSRIVYTRWRERGDDAENAIVVAGADGGGELALRRQQVEERPEFIGQPAWSPDGAKILYTRTRLGRDHAFRPSLHVMDAATGDSRLLAADAGDGAWSPDGRRIAFASVRDRNGKWCYEQCTLSGEIYTMDSDGTDLVRLTRNRGFDGSPSWSPDGRRIVFSSNRNVRGAPPASGSEIYSIHADGSCLTWLTNGSPDSGDPAWRGTPGAPAAADACAPAPRRPLVELDLSALGASDRHPAYWLGTRHRNALLGSAQGYTRRRSLRTYSFTYDDCASYDVRACRRQLQLQEDPVCSRTTILALLHGRGYRRGGRGGRLLVSAGRGDVRVLTGTTLVTIYSQEGVGPSRPALLAAARSLRQYGRPARRLPPPALPSDLLARIDRGEGARLIRLGRALDELPRVKAVSCPRR